MLDINYIKENPSEVIDRLAIKGKDAKEEIEAILRLDGERRELIAAVDSAKAEQNKTSKLIPAMKKEGKDTTELFAKMKQLSGDTKKNEEKLKEIGAVNEQGNVDLDTGVVFFGNKVLNALYQQMGMSKKAQGIVFSLPVSDVAGLVELPEEAKE